MCVLLYCTVPVSSSLILIFLFLQKPLLGVKQLSFLLAIFFFLLCFVGVAWTAANDDAYAAGRCGSGGGI